MNKSWNVDLVGMLATEEYVEEKYGKEAVYVNKVNQVQFNIKVISQPPENFPNVDLFTAYPSDIEPYGFEEQYTFDRYERKKQVHDFFENFLVIFNPIRRNRDGKDVYNVSNVRLVKKPSSFLENTVFTPIPIFTVNDLVQSFEDFLNRLWNDRFVGRIAGFSIEPDDTPPFVLWWEQETDSYYLVGEFEKHRYAHGGFAFEFNELKICKFDEKWEEDSVKAPKGEILFISAETYREMKERLDSSSALPFGSVPSLEEWMESGVEVPVQSIEPETSNAAATPQETDTAKATAAQASEPPKAQVHVKEEQSKQADEHSEEAFLAQLSQMAKDRGLLYSEKDLINFHTAMKSSSLVILAGMSGTGKSRLVELYGRALGLDEHQLTIIPVRPSWTDDADLIGYVDSIHNVYRPGDSGLVDMLREAAAEENFNKLYICMFDEMNLARVEHYFSQFLSVLEMPPNRRKLRLYNEELEARLYNRYKYPSSITIGENVMFVGTVNLDESTYHFSDKVLDRANVITLDVLPFRQLRDLKEKKVDRVNPLSLSEYRAFKNTSDTFQLLEREVEFLERLHEALNESRGQGIGHRIVRQIDAYMKNLPDTPVLDRKTAFDLQIVQRIMTKVRGPEEQLKPLLGAYNRDTGQTEQSSLLSLLEEFADISPFEKTKKALIQKAKELRLNGYTV
jgi:hypothetical protein